MTEKVSAQIETRHLPSCSGASRVGTITVARGQLDRGRGWIVARWGNVGWVWANAATPHRSRWALTAAACSREMSGFASTAAARLPGSFRQW